MLHRNVASTGDDRRTQNGHITNDTRDVSRRISGDVIAIAAGASAWKEN
jgi:hypothetical protein